MYTLQVLTAIAGDFVFGDPRFLPHPVRLIGRLCTFTEEQTRSQHAVRMPVAVPLYAAGGSVLAPAADRARGAARLPHRRRERATYRPRE